MKVLHLIETIGAGGAERLLHTNLKNFDPSLRNSVVTVYSGEGHFHAPIEALSVPVRSLGLRTYSDLPRGILRFSKMLRTQRPDLTHTHLWIANVIGRICGRAARIPVVSSIHNPEYEPEAVPTTVKGGPYKQTVSRWIDRLTARAGCDRMIAVSEYVRQSAHRRLGFPLDRIDLLYNPIDLAELSAPPARSRAELLAEVGIPEPSHVLLSVARVAPQKGLIHALRALARLERKSKETYLVSIGSLGDPAYVAQIEKEARARGLTERLRLLGPRRDVPDWLRACDLFLFPSLFEGLGIALVEAMAAGCACVASEIGPLSELIRDGVHGRLTPPGDEHALADAMSDLLADPDERARLGREAAAAARARFEPAAAARRLESIYRLVLGPGAA